MNLNQNLFFRQLSFVYLFLVDSKQQLNTLRHFLFLWGNWEWWYFVFYNLQSRELVLKWFIKSFLQSYRVNWVYYCWIPLVLKIVSLSRLLMASERMLYRVDNKSKRPMETKKKESQMKKMSERHEEEERIVGFSFFILFFPSLHH